MILAMIAAHDPKLHIGVNGEMPWHYREDLLYFKRVTSGHPVLMGRGVYEEVGEKPLPNRRNVVLSRTANWPGHSIEVCRSIPDALELLSDEERVFVIGGGEIYAQLLDQADELWITEIHKTYHGDTYFPEYRDRIGTDWREVSREDHEELSFVRYDRIRR
ncbi:MAG: dihydrofolate reductase [Bacteroidota bacterium]